MTLKHDNNIEQNNDSLASAKKTKPRFSELEPGFKKLRIFNICYAAAISIFCGCFMAWVIVANDPLKRFMSCFFMILVPILPFVLELIFKFRFSNFVLTFTFTYALVAGVLGSVVHLYHYLPGFDKFVHVLLGYTSGIAGLFALVKLKDYKNMRLATTLLFFFGAACAVGCVWEILEYASDLFLGQTAQGMPINGVTSVADTMGDIIANSIGAVIFMIHYAIHAITKKNLLIGAIIKDFSTSGRFSNGI